MIFVRSQVEVGEPNQEAGAISEPHDTGHSDSRVISLLLFHVKQGVSKPGVRSASLFSSVPAGTAPTSHSVNTSTSY